MLDLFSSVYRRYHRRWVYPFLSLTVILGLVLGKPLVSQALPWGDLILQGIQVVQLSNISDSKEVSLGKDINAQLVNTQVRLYRDPAINQYIDQIGQRLAAKSDRPNIPYTFQVVDDKSVNAFATMGGFVYVNTGLLKLADNEAELASVIGHEIGHIAARHAIKQMRELAIARGITTAAGLNRSTAVNLGVELAISRPNSRKDEYEADQKGLVNIQRVGYSQQAMVTFMKKLLNQQGSSVPTVLSTHPGTADRITRLNQAISAAGSKTAGTGLDNAAYKAKMQKLLS